jgi:hypothetical protein
VAEQHLPPQWRERLLCVVAAKAGTENMRLLAAWQRAEGGTAKWNPLNTTMPLPGSTSYNTIGVQNYKRATEGVCAQALTLANGLYNGILGDLQGGGKTAEEIVHDRADQLKHWGTDPHLILKVLGE